MKNLLIATAALSLLAAPALAQSGPTDVPLTGSVTAQCGGGDDRPGPRHAQHVLEVNRAERRLAWDQHEAAAFLQRHVGRPLHQ